MYTGGTAGAENKEVRKEDDEEEVVVVYLRRWACRGARLT